MTKIRPEHVVYDTDSGKLTVDLSGTNLPEYSVRIVVGKNEYSKGEVITMDISNGEMENMAVRPVEFSHPLWPAIVDQADKQDVDLNYFDRYHKSEVLDKLSKDVENMVAERLADLNLGVPKGYKYEEL